jgi:hypothetical protein
LFGLLFAIDEFFCAELQLVGWLAERVEGFRSLAGEHPEHVAVDVGGEREREPFGLPRQRLAVQSDVGVGQAGRLVQPRVAWVLALGS